MHCTAQLSHQLCTLSLLKSTSNRVGYRTLDADALAPAAPPLWLWSWLWLWVWVWLRARVLPRPFDARDRLRAGIVEATLATARTHRLALSRFTTQSHAHRPDLFLSPLLLTTLDSKRSSQTLEQRLAGKATFAWCWV